MYDIAAGGTPEAAIADQAARNLRLATLSILSESIDAFTDYDAKNSQFTNAVHNMYIEAGKAFRAPANGSFGKLF